MEECTFSPKISKQDRNGVKGPRKSAAGFENFARNEEQFQKKKQNWIDEQLAE